MNRFFTTALMITGFVIMLNASAAQAANLSLGVAYRYDLNIPGQDSIQDGSLNFYQDDPHDVYNNPSAFDTGDLTDGVLGNGTNDANVPSPVVAMWNPNSSTTLLPVDIIFDLGSTYSVTDIIIGTSLRGDNGANGNFAPDDVSISFSTDDSTYSTPVNFALWALSDLTGDAAANTGHHEKTLAATSPSARYVKLSFDGQAQEKYVLDEVTINGIPEPASLTLLGIGGLLMLRRKARV